MVPNWGNQPVLNEEILHWVVDGHPAQADLIRFSAEVGSGHGASVTLHIERIPIVSYLGTEYVLLRSRTQEFRRSL